MKLAVTGKGGSGKTALAALLARSVVERGWRVLAVDVDTNAGLAMSLGAPAHGQSPIDAGLEVQVDAPYGAGLAHAGAPVDLVRRYGMSLDEDVVFVGPTKFERLGQTIGPSVTAVRQLAERFAEPRWITIVDLEAGPTSLFEACPAFADLALVVVEATPASMLAASRLAELLAYEGVASALVVNKARGEADTELVEAELGEVLATIPFDLEVRRCEREGSLADLPATSPALVAVRELVERLGVGVPEQAGPGWSGRSR